MHLIVNYPAFPKISHLLLPKILSLSHTHTHTHTHAHTHTFFSFLENAYVVGEMMMIKGRAQW